MSSTLAVAVSSTHPSSASSSSSSSPTGPALVSPVSGMARLGIGLASFIMPHIPASPTRIPCKKPTFETVPDVVLDIFFSMLSEMDQLRLMSCSRGSVRAYIHSASNAYLPFCRLKSFLPSVFPDGILYPKLRQMRIKLPSVEERTLSKKPTEGYKKLIGQISASCSEIAHLEVVNGDSRAIQCLIQEKLPKLKELTLVGSYYFDEYFIKYLNEGRSDLLVNVILTQKIYSANVSLIRNIGILEVTEHLRILDATLTARSQMELPSPRTIVLRKVPIDIHLLKIISQANHLELFNCSKIHQGIGEEDYVEYVDNIFQHHSKVENIVIANDGPIELFKIGELVAILKSPVLRHAKFPGLDDFAVDLLTTRRHLYSHVKWIV